MKRRTRYVLVLVLAAVLINLPLVHSTWTDAKVQRNGVDVQATVVAHESAGGQHLLTFRFPQQIDPAQRTWRVEVDASTYDRAANSGQLDVRVVPDDPSAYSVPGETGDTAMVVVTIVADVILLLVALLLLRFGLGRRPRLQAVAVEDVQRCAPGVALERVGGETYLVRGEVAEVEPDRVVLDLGERSIVVLLDGHHNPVGHQQPAQVHARLV